MKNQTQLTCDNSVIKRLKSPDIQLRGERDKNKLTKTQQERP